MSTSSRTPRLPGRLLAAARVRPEESDLAIRMISFFAVTQASHGVAANTADSLFFDRYGVESLPLMIFLSGLAVMLATIVYSAGLARLGSRRWLGGTTTAAAVWVVAEWGVVLTGAQVVYPVIWISAQVAILLTLTVMWNAAAAACTTRQAKRLFPLFASAGVAGGIVGNLLVGPLASLLGTQNLLLIQGVLLLSSTAILGRLASFFGDTSGRDRVRAGGMRRAWTAIRSSSLLRLAAVVAALLSAVFYLVVFPFSEAVAAAFEDEARIAWYLGIFSSIATAATFLFSLLATSRLIARLGVVVTLVIVPVVYAGGFALWLVGFGLVTATLVRGAQWIAVNAIQGTSFNALFNVLSGRERGPVLALMTAVPAQLGTMLAGLILIASDALSRTAQLGIGLVLSAAALVAVMRMRPAYISAVVDAVRKGLVGMFDVPQQGVVTPVDGDAARVLAAHLDDRRPQARALAVTGLARLGAAPRVIEPLLDDDDPHVRSAAFASICEVDPAVMQRHLSAALSDESPDVRLDALRYLESVDGSDGESPGLEAALDDPDPRVRTAAAWLVGGDSGTRVVRQMVEAGEPTALAAILEEVARSPSRPMGVVPARYVDHDDPSVRTSAAAALASLEEDLALLRPLLDDASVRVRNAAARALAGSSSGRQVLIEVLGEGSVMATEAALRAVSPIRDADSESFIGWARREAGRAARLDAYRRSLQGHPSSSREEEFLIDVLAQRADRLVQWVLLAMTTEETEKVMPVVSRGVRSDDAETNSQAIEALENIGAKSVLEVLLPLLESPEEPDPESGRSAALRELAEDFDPWLRALALRSLGREGRAHGDDDTVPGWLEMSDEGTSELDEMGRVLVIQAVPMFSGLDPEDLLLIARATSEVQYDPGDLIYREGDVGTALLLIVAGRVEVSRTRNGDRHLIRVYGEGEHVGELSLLHGGERSADVHAGPGGVDGLVLSKADLLSILEERPSVALGMLGTLAGRLVDQTD